jgi:type I restriction enzyme S subunit
LVERDQNDEPASVLLQRIATQHGKSISDNAPYRKVEGKTIDIEDEIPFYIPESWCWIRLGSICSIARGGSPRPIKSYLTNDKNGINWIKIGDTEKDEKYINKAHEKIKFEGVSKSRFVSKGDFLLTNSMSFGRPYILNIEGCIHDGWLVLSDYKKAFDIDFLYYILSSQFAYFQFCGQVSGSVVKNLNIDKVAISLFPLPPLKEQKRIVLAIETAFKQLDSILENIT